MPTMSDEQDIPEILREYEAKGFTGQFSVREAAMMHCHGCSEDSPAAQVPVEAMHRLEGNTDPEDEAIVLALECPACGAWGTAVLPYGPASGPEDAAVLAELMDDRDHSVVDQGL